MASGGMNELYRKLDKLGRVRLSTNFEMRQFLHSEISAAFGIPNVPDNPDLAIETGTKLCTEILEPLVSAFGPLIIRSGFRSAKLNAFGRERGLNCASNKRNFAYHIWDHTDVNGNKGAAACVRIPVFDAGKTEHATWEDLAWWIDDNLPYHRLTFFKSGAFNIGWHEQPRHEIFSRYSTPQWLKR